MTTQTESDQNGFVHPKNALNDLNSKEWIIETISVWNQKGLGCKSFGFRNRTTAPSSFFFYRCQSSNKIFYEIRSSCTGSICWNRFKRLKLALLRIEEELELN